ncbi:unnamed protein product, partial [Amoebophrya sp. A120]
QSPPLEGRGNDGSEGKISADLENKAVEEEEERDHRTQKVHATLNTTFPQPADLFPITEIPVEEVHPVVVQSSLQGHHDEVVRKEQLASTASIRPYEQLQQRPEAFGRTIAAPSNLDADIRPLEQFLARDHFGYCMHVPAIFPQRESVNEQERVVQTFLATHGTDRRWLQEQLFGNLTVVQDRGKDLQSAFIFNTNSSSSGLSLTDAFLNAVEQEMA